MGVYVPEYVFQAIELVTVTVPTLDAIMLAVVVNESWYKYT